MGEYLQADSFADIYDFTSLLNDITKKAWGDDWGQMRPHFSSTEDAEDIPLPIITYEVVDRKPTPERGEIKPRIRNKVQDPDTGETINLYGQWFDYILQFNVWDKSVQNVIDLLGDLEKLILTYTGYFKQQGVSELLFEEQLRDDKLTKWDESLNVRSIRYKVRIEVLQVIATGVLEDIDIEKELTAKL